ncbi:MAG: phage holin [Actinobacteria bacterium]|nr:phage holin [Actinomycetota bacterium]
MTTTKSPILSNRLYDILKHVTQIILPALGTLYFALAQIWGLAAGEEVVGTIIALTAFLGVTLGLSNASYKKSGARFDGSIDVWEDEDTKQFMLNMDDDPYELEKRDQVVFKVNRVGDDI